jgi:hypothetical protein
MTDPEKADEEPAPAIETPRDNDILSGRGNFVNFHPGNERFRAAVRKHKVQYVAAAKCMKPKFAEMILDEIKLWNPPGRFLRQDDTTKLWYDIGDKKALDKTRQALREGAPEIQKEISGQDAMDVPDIHEHTVVHMQENSAGMSNMLPCGHQFSQGFRQSEYSMNPPFLTTNVSSNFSAFGGGFHHTVPLQMQMQQQQLAALSTNMPMLSQTIQEEDSDPYLSSLPVDHFETNEYSQEVLSQNMISMGKYQSGVSS